ncbi:MAG: amino acid permease [Anaerolineaceae bacterium]|nr:amino acid permease [Anaerolineaceae bacterium]
MSKSISCHPNANQNGKLGTWSGVFTPTVLTILGAIMYLREGWVVGNAGLGGALMIIVLANAITASTALSISSVSTNIRVRAGGAFSIIAQSLGLEVGGSISLPLYLAQSISVAFYLFAFTEGWVSIFPNHPDLLVLLISFLIAFTIALVSANFAARFQYGILAVMVISLISVFLGSFAILGKQGMIHTPQVWGTFDGGNFWQVFAVFFPAVTGVLAGVNMSGDLKDPRDSIPKGTLLAVGLSFIIYICLAYWLSRVASPEELVNNLTIMVDKSTFGPAVQAGILAATFSSALTSMVGAPRLLQALSEQQILPNGHWLAKLTSKSEPRNAMLITGILAIGALVFGLAGGGLNAIAPLITMFFLIAYATLNGVVLLEQNLRLVSFRPLFSIPWIVPLVGLLGCVFVMFLINPTFSLVAITVVLGIYAYLTRRQLTTPWSDVRSGLFVNVAEWAAKRTLALPTDQERAWKPSLLMPITSSDTLLGSYRFIKALTAPRGSIRVVGISPEKDPALKEKLRPIMTAFGKDGIFAHHAILRADNLKSGAQVSMDVFRSTFFRPNILFLVYSKGMREKDVQAMYNKAIENEMGMVLFAPHSLAGLGREQLINIWIREQSPNWEIGLRLRNLDLSLLLAYQIARNWRGSIQLTTVVNEEKNRLPADNYLQQLTRLGRMPQNTKTVVYQGVLDEFLPQASLTDLQIFGLPEWIDLNFVKKMVSETKSTCIFVHDSGHESALV